MEHRKILNLLNEGNDSKFVTRNSTLPMIIQKRIIMQVKLPTIQKF